MRHRALYAAFDRVPSRKGAAVHIERFAGTLFAERGGGLLYVLAPPDAPLHAREDGVEVVRFGEQIPGVLARGRAYAHRLHDLLEQHAGSLEVCHFRDPFAGVPIVSRPDRRYRAVYEVNGLPSVELPTRRPATPARVVRRLRQLERHCMTGADRFVVPSPVIADHLRGAGVPAQAIEVVPNGADVHHGEMPRPPGAPPRYAIYFGALQPWQGADTLLRAMARVPELELVVVAARRDRFARAHERLAERLGVERRITWLHELGAEQLRRWVQHAFVSLAPLRDCARNTRQGCAPLKVIESMAAGVPVVGSNLRVIRELVSGGEQGLLVPPDRPHELARALRVLLDDPERAAAMGRRGREHVAGSLTWEHATDRLRLIYRSMPAHG